MNATARLLQAIELSGANEQACWYREKSSFHGRNCKRVELAISAKAGKRQEQMAGGQPAQGNQDAKNNRKKKGRADARYIEIAIMGHVIGGKKRKYENRGKRKQEPGKCGRRRAIMPAAGEVNKKHQQ